MVINQLHNNPFVQFFKVIYCCDNFTLDLQVISCTLTSVRCSDLDPVLASLLLEDLALVWSQIIFVGLDCGQVYCVPVAAEIRSASVAGPKIIYSTTQSIAGIVCLRGWWIMTWLIPVSFSEMIKTGKICAHSIK